MIIRAITYITGIYNIRKKQGFLYLLRFAFCPGQTRRWLDYISQNSLLLEYDNTRLDLAAKIYRPFLRTSYKVGDRISLLMDHLNTMMVTFPQAIVRKILNEEVIELAKIEGKKASYCIIMFRDKKFGKEGELSIALQDSKTAVSFATVSFVFGKVPASGKLVLILGGLQGPTPHHGLLQDSKQSVIETTKNLSGLRPKRAVMEAVAAIARTTGAVVLCAPSNVTHVSRQLSENKQRIYSNYAAFWEELGGVPVEPDGDYRIPVQFLQRTLEQVPSKKRRDWLIRTQHLKMISASVPRIMT